MRALIAPRAAENRSSHRAPATLGLGAVVLAVALLASACGHGHSTGAAATASRVITSSGVGPTVSAITPAPAKSTASKSAGPKDSASKSAAPTLSTVPSQTVDTKAPVALDQTAVFGGKVSAALDSVTAITATARGIGEVAGPALKITATIDNGSSKTIDLGNVVMNVTDSQGNPGNQMSASPSKPFTGTLAAGKTAHAVYVFTISTKTRTKTTVSLSYSAGAPVVLFTGNAS